MRQPARQYGVQNFVATGVAAPMATSSNKVAIEKTQTMKPIWIVDDDKSIRWVLEKALARENIACKLFSSAQDALIALKTEAPQVLVSEDRKSTRLNSSHG